MKVKELIEKLQEFDQEKNIEFWVDNDLCCDDYAYSINFNGSVTEEELYCLDGEKTIDYDDAYSELEYRYDDGEMSSEDLDKIIEQILEEHEIKAVVIKVS